MPAVPPRDLPALVAARRLAAGQGGVVSRRQLYAAGVTRWQVRGQVRSGRWQLVGDQSVCLHNTALGDEGHRWAAVFQGGPRACLDGASALVAGGLQRYDVDRVRVSVPRGARVRRSRRYDIRQTRRWDAADVVGTGVPRTRPAVAAVRAALWAATDRQAAYVLTLTVQQGLATAPQVGVEALRVRRDRRRVLVQQVVHELLEGARTLDEAAIVRELVRRGLPAPARQVVRRGRNGRYVLDLYWPEHGLVVEVDGIQHAWVDHVVGDAVRHNDLVLAGDRVLRVPMLGLRLEPDTFYGQIGEALGVGRHAE
ncbi:DUF559 domain-containing protein [Nocardioides sp. zg-579]|uniref:DUF559 domain-containing protein n=1 Tax=Nocardioides marmotae TaxID=2663857 RepID=A0A6I3J0G5_9ACTN|nr:DUF559 domain-containing protein [Nocardioides marmotae]MCR6031338.1 DUF559 domain-containing protein [Gordonia jinghuaiqii]MTB94977.1 DUF559 domain-containing protein [Nocardioides marmotae]QKE02516.1 DUF559 domain-containing protein [Nocardioides marmotae]